MTAQLNVDRQASAISAVRGVLARLIPERAGEFRLDLLPAGSEPETFEISGGGKNLVTLRGSTPLMITAGLNWYLKHHCYAHVSWCGNQLQLPKPLPTVDKTIRMTCPYRYRYYLNYCTFSYSMAFWDWARWEREIDWMALAGIGLPLAITGQEAVWQKVYQQFGLTDHDLAGFFAGPAFLAWGWMGNLDGWGGPLPQSWIDGQRALQVKILRRQRELGMKPVLPSFTGHVPAAFAAKYPKANIKQMKNWAETFPGTHILDPADPLFQEIGHKFIDEQRRMFGVDLWGDQHFYSCDTFNENTPPNNDPTYLETVGHNLYRGMAGADPKAVWVLQDWMFYFNPVDPGFWGQPQINALLKSVSAEQLLILDLHSEGHPLWRRTESLCGQPWVWCCLHNFGDHRSMYGNLARLAHDAPEAQIDPARGRLEGMGLTPEGIDQNPVIYDLAIDLMWRREEPDLTKWLDDYAHRRYGAKSTLAMAAWEVLRRTAYDRPPQWSSTTNTLINLSPRFSAERVVLSYPPHRLIPAWEGLAAAADEFGHVDPFRYDLVDVARQVMANLATALHDRVVIAYEQKDAKALEAACARFLELMDDMDTLLATRREFLLGIWLEDAKAWGTNDAERRLYEWNARSQITLWGDQHSMLRDYARKEWAGLIRDFYRHRWSRFFDELARCVANGTHLHDRELQHELRQWEEQWTHRTDTFATEPAGDSMAIARGLLEKYHPIFAEVYRVHANLVTGKPVTASAGTAAGHPPENAVTGIADRSSYWSASPGTQWIQVDLQKSTEVDTVRIFPYWDGRRAYQYTVETSLDASTWSVVVDAGKNTAPATAAGDSHQFAVHSVRYLRVAVLQNTANEAVHLLDMRAYGPSCRPT